MMSMREHIYGTYCSNHVILAENLKIPCLRSWITADIDHSVWGSIKNHLSNIRMDTCSRRIEDDYIRMAMFFNKRICQNIIPITCIEVAIGDIVVGSLDLCVLNSLRHVLDTDYFRCLTRYELSNGTGTCVKVINDL